MKLHDIIEISKIQRNSLDKLIDVILMQKDLYKHISATWRVKDVLAHISWHEREMENLITHMSLEGSEYWLLPMKERNEKILQEFFDVNEHTILSEYKQSFTHMIGKMKNMKVEATTDPNLFDKMPLEWEPWKVIAGNTFEHYEDHARQLQNHFDYLS